MSFKASEGRTFHVIDATERCNAALHTVAIQTTGKVVYIVHKEALDAEWKVCDALTAPIVDAEYLKNKQAALRFVNELPASKKNRTRK